MNGINGPSTSALIAKLIWLINSRRLVPAQNSRFSLSSVCISGAQMIFKDASETLQLLRDYVRWAMFGCQRRLIANPRNRKFDRRYGVDTADEIALVNTGINPHDSKRGNEIYRCVWSHLFHAAMTALPIDFSRFTFIDYGSGKGKAMLLASDYPFKRIIGVEYAPSLHDIAVRNCSVYRNPTQCCKRLEPVLVDAVQFTPPNEPLVCHFFNPFDTDTMQSVLAKLQSLRRRDIYVAYINVRSIVENKDVIQDSFYVTPIAVRKKFAILRVKPHPMLTVGAMDNGHCTSGGRGPGP